MLKLTRVAALALIALAVVLAIAAFALGRRKPPAAPAPVVVQAEAPPTVAAVQTTAAPASLPLGFALRLNPGERALAVPVDELVAAGNRILPGDHVDVFLNLRAPSGTHTDGQAQTRLLLSRLRVLSYGAADTAPSTQNTTDEGSDAGSRDDSRAADIQGSRASANTGGTAQAPARSAVLAVPVAEANRLLLGAQQGKLFLALRNPTDVGLPDQDLFASPAAVLSPRRDLSPEQRVALASPENGAFAGLDADALAGHRSARATTTPPPTTGAAPSRRAAPRPDRGVEIIRGEPSSHRGSR